MRRASFLALAAVALLCGAATASAHVTVLPETATLEQSQEFTIRVPTERPLPTTEVRVSFPASVTVYAFAPSPAGWTTTPVERGGRFVGVRYSGGRIPVNGYVDFHVLGTPTVEGTAAWKAWQTYADGKIKPWSDPPEAPGAVSRETGPTDPGPASGVVVSATAQPLATAAPASGGGGSGAAVWLGVIAVALSALACLGVGLLWSSRPMRLPDDEPDEGAR